MIGAGGRGIVWCAAAFLTGNVVGNLWYESQWISLATISAALSGAIAAALAQSKGRPGLQWLTVLSTFAILGAIGSQMPKTFSVNDRRKKEISEKFERMLTKNGTLSGHEDEIGVLKALSIGDKSGLSRQVKKNFRASGATHLLALSGLHVGVIYKLIGYMLIILGGAPWAKRIRSLITLTFLWWFAVTTGLSPSIFRAVLMITIYETGTLIGRRSDGLNSLAASAIIITLMDPRAPMELSFQMSFCACLSIFTIFPYLNAMMVTRIKPLQFIWDSATLAISCQMTTGVIAWLKFGTFPKYFIISNLLTVPLVAVIMWLMAAAILTSNLPVTGSFFADTLIRATGVLNLITETIATL